MALPTGFWGIDIGQCALKALRLEMIDGKPTATAFDFVEHPKILSQPDADPDQLTRESLEKFLSRNTLGKDQVAIAVAGQSGLARFVKLPPVEEKRIGDIVKFEAKQQIPFPLEEVVWDYQKIAGGEVTGGFAMETEIGLFAMKRDNIARAMGHFNGAGVDVHMVQMAPLAICNYATYELLGKGGPDGSSEPGAPPMDGEEETPRGKKRCAVIMDIGTDASNLIITDGGKIIWQRPVPLGGNNFTRALTKEMKLTFAKAEHLKRNAAKSPDLPAILKALRPVLTDFVGEVQRSLGYFTNTHRDAHVAYMIGLGNAFKLPGLQKYLQEKLSLIVHKPDGVNRLAGDQIINDPVFTENVLAFPIAYGLALQGVNQARIGTNLLPGEIRVDRQIRMKKPWAAAAAAALLLGTGTLTGAYALQNSRVTDSGVVASLGKVKSAGEAATAQASEQTKKEGELADTIKEVKSIIAGQDERLNWIRLNEVIAAALPRPGDTGNLTGERQIPYWSSQPGRRALQKYEDRLRKGLPADQAWEDDQSQFLATVNVESIYT
jgi:type IV pilus assembly protein PilM